MLRTRVATYLPGSRLPGIVELARQFGTTEHVTRKALGVLSGEGILEARFRGGHFTRQTSDGRLRQLRSVVALIPDPLSRSLHAQSILLGIDAQCGSHGLRLSVRRISQTDGDLSPGELHLLTEAGLDPTVGLAAIMFRPPAELLANWARQGVPMVLIDEDLPAGVLVNAVLVDQQGAICHATERLIGMGHRRVAYMDLKQPNTTYWVERLAGYREALANHRIPFDPLLVRDDPVGVGERKLAEQLDLLLKLPEPPTGLVAGNQRAGCDILDACRELHIAVPTQLSVISGGVHRRDLGDRVKALSRFDQGPPDEMGRAGVDLLRGLNTQRRPVTIHLPSQWVDCGSAAPPGQ